jgi:tetratricopeptide (TPR) repeat protein
VGVCRDLAFRAVCFSGIYLCFANISWWAYHSQIKRDVIPINRKKKIMKNTVLLLSIICFASFSFSQSEIDTNISYLEQFIGVYPPQVKDQNQLNQVKKIYKETEKQLIELDKKNKNDAKLKCKIGNLYRLGHNLDEKKAWEKSEQYFNEAVKIDSTEYEAFYLLGCLYVNSDVKLAPKAEALFLLVKCKTTGELQMQALWGLCISSWMQGKKKLTLELTTEYLKQKPNDEAAISLHGIAEKGVKAQENK